MSEWITRCPRCVHNLNYSEHDSCAYVGQVKTIDGRSVLAYCKCKDESHRITKCVTCGEKIQDYQSQAELPYGVVHDSCIPKGEEIA